MIEPSTKAIASAEATFMALPLVQHAVAETFPRYRTAIDAALRCGFINGFAAGLARANELLQAKAKE